MKCSVLFELEISDSVLQSLVEKQVSGGVSVAVVPSSLNVVRICKVLTPHQKIVFELLQEGLHDKEIAERTHTSVRTVKFHVSKFLKIFGVRSRHQLISRD